MRNTCEESAHWFNGTNGLILNQPCFCGKTILGTVQDYKDAEIARLRAEVERLTHERDEALCDAYGTIKGERPLTMGRNLGG